MKKTSVVFGLVILTIGAQVAMCGEISVGITGGLNIATVRGDDVENWDSRTAAFFGGFVEYPFTPVVSIQPELLYTMKGASQTDDGDKATAKLNYVEIPVLLRVNIPMEGNVRPFLVAGPGIGFKLSSKVEVNSHEEDIEDVKGTDFGFIFGGGVSFPVGNYMMSVAARYELGLTSIDDSEDEDDVKNSVISIGAGLGF
jgi:hypothetical protein